MQPYFFPYIGYFDLIQQSDRWVVFDTAQYIRHGWVNRNRILHPTSEWQYIIVPVQHHHQDTPINEICILEDNKWRDKLIGQLQHYKKKAPFFTEVTDMVATCLDDSDESLSRLNVRTQEIVCTYLGIPFRYAFFSEMDLKLGPVEGPGDWALRIAEALGASEYINPPGGAQLFDRSMFEAAGITLTIQTPVDFVYNCDGYEFQSDLSILDVLMWNSPEVVRAYLASRFPGQQPVSQQMKDTP
jgi:hypothetical protein